MKKSFVQIKTVKTLKHFSEKGNPNNPPNYATGFMRTVILKYRYSN